jgi:hypothetical protein
MTPKTKNILKWIPSGLAGCMITMSALLKLSSSPELIEHYAQLNMLHYINMLGVMELLFIALYLYPKTMKIGFLLITAYFGGAIATEISHGNSFIFPMIILTLVWVAAWLRNPALFKERHTRKRVRNYSKIFALADQ